MYYRLPMGGKQKRECLSTERGLSEKDDGGGVRSTLNYVRLTNKLGRVRSSQRKFSVSNSFWRQRQAKESCGMFAISIYDNRTTCCFLQGSPCLMRAANIPWARAPMPSLNISQKLERRKLLDTAP